MFYVDLFHIRRSIVEKKIHTSTREHVGLTSGFMSWRGWSMFCFNIRHSQNNEESIRGDSVYPDGHPANRGTRDHAL